MSIRDQSSPQGAPAKLIARLIQSLPLVSSGTLADDSEALKLAAIVQPTAIVNPYVTQNVYGFADFTTTIGNTVMIFSPSSIAMPGEIAIDTSINHETLL